MRTLAPTDLTYFDHAPVRIVSSTVIPTTPAALFEILADAGSWPSWFPLMHRAAWIGAAQGGHGVEREVGLRMLGRFRERMIGWEPGARFAFTMIATSSPLVRQLAEDYRLTAVDGGTRLDWVMAATPTALGKVGMPVMRRIVSRLFVGAGRRLRARVTR